MKPFSSKKFRPLFFFTKNKKFTSVISVFLTLSFLNLITSCSYYNVRDVTTSPETIAKQVEDFNMNQKYAVIHSGGDIFHLNNLVINEDTKTITGVIQSLNELHGLSNREKRVHKYVKSKQQPLNEVHFMLENTMDSEIGSPVSIPFSNIKSISVNDKNTGRSIANVFFGTIGALAVVAIIIAATKSSCPFVYVKNGEEFVFTGELYPGVLTANQQRDDYLPLPNTMNTNNEYTIKISNELKEIQYTDFVQLLEIEHPNNVQILLDKNGNLHSFSNVIGPKNVLVDNTNIDNAPVLNKDNNSYLFNSEINNASSIRNIELKFKNSKQTDKAKLLLTVKNSMWLDYVFGNFNERFGTYYAKFQKDQQGFPKEKSIKWMNEQNIPLSVYIKTNNGWDLIDRINTVGPMSFRDIAVPVDLSKAGGEDIVIKLETGFMFWEVDYAGIDFTDNVNLDINYIEPFEAFDGNKNVTKLISELDETYFVQPNIGDEVVVTFKTSAPIPDINRTYFLKNRGYYNYIRTFEGEPDFQKLRLFKEPGSFTDFSMYEYEVLMDFENRMDLASTNN